MYFINPFKALRPTKENASSVAIASTDHLGEGGKKVGRLSDQNAESIFI